jgi:hypothetical protein
LSYSETQLKVLAKEDPQQLVKILNNLDKTDITTLTFGAEVLGEEVSDETIVLPIFKKLLKHIHALVREGAMLGVSSFYADKAPPADILDRLKIISTNDPSPMLKEYAKDLLKDFS